MLSGCWLWLSLPEDRASWGQNNRDIQRDVETLVHLLKSSTYVLAAFLASPVCFLDVAIHYSLAFFLFLALLLIIQMDKSRQTWMLSYTALLPTEDPTSQPKKHVGTVEGAAWRLTGRLDAQPAFFIQFIQDYLPSTTQSRLDPPILINNQDSPSQTNLI